MNPTSEEAAKSKLLSAQILHKNGKYDESLKVVTKAFEIGSSRVIPHIRIVNCYLLQGMNYKELNDSENAFKALKLAAKFLEEMKTVKQYGNLKRKVEGALSIF